MTRDLRWLPHEYQDEMIPPMRESPEEWLASLDDGEPALDAADPDGDPDSAWSRPRRLQDGEIVAFDHFTDYGSGTLVVHPDGSYSADPPMPTEANCLRCDFDYVGGSIDDLLHGGGFGDEPLKPGTYLLGYYHWTEQPIRFRFDAAARRFVPAEGGERDPA